MPSPWVLKFLLLILILSTWMAVQATAEVLPFTILHTNDEHSSLNPRRWIDDPSSTVGGFSRLATAVQEIKREKKREDEPLLLLSGADFIGGSPYAWLILQGMAVELTLMQEIGYQVITIGNHEFDYGPHTLARYLQEAGYPEANEKTVLLSSNIHPPAHYLLHEVGIEKTHIQTLENGLVVGFLGLIGLQAQEYTVDTGEVIFQDPEVAAREAVAVLQKAEVDVIIAITHSGLHEDRELARNVPGIHLIVGGHCHTALHEPERVLDTLIVQAGSRLEFMGLVELAYNREEGKLHLRNEENQTPYLIPLDDSFPEDERIQKKVEEATEVMAGWIQELTQGCFSGLYDEVAYSDFKLSHSSPLEETPFGNFVTDAMRLVAEEKTGKPVDFAFQAHGMIRGSLLPREEPGREGLLTFYDLTELSSLGRGADNSPGNSLSAFYLTSEEVWRVLEVTVFLSQHISESFFFQVSGLRYQYDAGRTTFFTVPFLKTPLPSARAVLQVEKFIGEGIQGQNPVDYRPLERGDGNLYRIVCDTTLLTFLPLVGEVLPRLTIVPRKHTGEPYERLEDTIIRIEGREYKVWQALLEYASAQPQNELGRPHIAPYYQKTHHRIEATRGLPFVTWPLLALLLLTAGILFF